jgi:ABC-type sugar transport system ATPase subunit
MSAPALSVRGLHKRYRAGIPGCLAEAAVLRGVDLDVHAGEVVVVVGAPGAGKSTLLFCAAGLLRPDAGSVRWHGDASRSAAGTLAQGVWLLRDGQLRHVSEPGGVTRPRPPATPVRSTDRALLVVDACPPTAPVADGPAGARALAAVLRHEARRGAAALVARRAMDAVCAAADRVLLLRDGVCREVCGAAWGARWAR